MGNSPSHAMPYSAAIEKNAVWYGRFIELPGTHAHAVQRQMLLEEMERELLYHVNWLRIHKEKVPSPDMSFTIAEEAHNILDLGESGGEVAFFTFDTREVTKEEMTEMVRLMGYSREDLLEKVKKIPLFLRPIGKKRTILDILNHVCNAEEFYISRFGEEADSMYEENSGMKREEIDELPIFERLATVRNACVETLKELVPQKKGSIFTRSEYTLHAGEKWSARKVMRRFLEHEREHYYNILEYMGEPLRQL